MMKRDMPLEAIVVMNHDDLGGVRRMNYPH